MMSQPHSPSDAAASAQRPATASAEQPAPPHWRRYWPAALGLVVAGLLVAGAVAYYHGERRKEPPCAETALCRQFAALKNDHDPAANDLLGPVPTVPAAAVSPEEADQLHAEFFLHGDYQVVSVQPETADVSGPDARFALVLKGNVSSPRIPQTGPKGTDVINRSLTDPDIIVRVEDHTIRAVSWRLHHDPNEKQPSAEEQRQFREDLERQQREQLRQLRGEGRRGGK
jgi:hypothetical protein